MVRFLFEFVGRSYHATPWGHHVNEGLVEWPPSPWRIIRALIATGYTKLGWQEIPEDMHRLVEAMAGRDPSYRLPRAASGHSRHYMPVKGMTKNVPKTGLVIDAFLEPEGPVAVEWPIAADFSQMELLGELLRRMGYLGRAESRVRARLAQPEEKLPEISVSVEKQSANDEPVRLLAPVSASEYIDWRKGVKDAPVDLIAALQMDTRALQRSGWNIPPGARELIYWLPPEAFRHSKVMSSPNSAVSNSPLFDTALFVLSTDFKRTVLPLMERAFPTMALFRRALLAKVGDPQRLGACPELTGKDVQGLPLRSGHKHAHFIPLSLDGHTPPRIDHVLVHAPMGLGAVAEKALRSIRRSWAKGFDEVVVTLIAIGRKEAFQMVGGQQIRELSSGDTWVSRTPFVPPRHLKPHGKDSLKGQVCAELERRGLPRLAAPPVVASPTLDSEYGRDALWFRRFALNRQGQEALPPPCFFHLTLRLERPIEGPLCLGWGSHFGLGSFVPLESSLQALGSSQV